MAKPTIDTIMGRKTVGESYWNRLHREMDEDHSRFNDTTVIAAPAGYRVVKLGTARAKISTAADHIAGDAPQVKVPEAGITLEAQARSERLEKGLQAALWRAQQVGAENPIRALVINGLWSGMMVSQGPIFLADEWGETPVASDYESEEEYKAESDDYETTKKVKWPFFWRAVDPRYVYPDPGTLGKKWVIVAYQRTIGSIREQWPEWDGRSKGMSRRDEPLSEDTKVDWVEYWDEHYRAYLVGGEFIDKIREHRYGKPPFQIRSAGYGEETGEPHERFRSLIYPARPLLDQEIVAASQLDAIMRRTAWPIVLTPFGSGFNSLEPGTVKEMNADAIAATKVFTELRPELVQTLVTELTFLQDRIDLATTPSTVQGMRARGISSGYGQNSLVAQAKVRYGPAVVNLASLLSEYLVDLGRCIRDVVQEDVPVWGHTRWGFADAVLRSDDLQGLRHVIVTVNPKLPTDRANEVAIGQVLLGLGAIDIDTFNQTYAGHENPGELRVKVLRDRALASPEVQRILSFAAAMETGFMDKVFGYAEQLGIPAAQLLQILGFGAPQQMTASTQSYGGAPMNKASQMALPQGSDLGQNNKPQPTPGGPFDQAGAAAAVGVPVR